MRASVCFKEINICKGETMRGKSELKIESEKYI